ncbi:unnamed protein product [Brachionus calyciflorus]|uniref:Large ribosomal subunit protein uL24m n=1 Tax=Brachionus calyciflorus TaxID=104777 RepID=A0A813QYN8_9BILA|nr:unnamed protein product [Brachionus calyciflorus]
MVKLTAILNWNGFHNIPKKYIKRAMFNGVVYENTHEMTPPVIYNYTKDWVFDEYAPWTKMAQIKNDPRKQRSTLIVPPLREWFFFRGDKVQIMTGKDAGKQGLINAIIKQRNWVFVSGLNCKLTLQSSTGVAGDGEYTMVEKPLVVNRDVKLIDPSDLKPCEVTFRFTEDGEKVRVSKRTGQVLPIPPDAEATIDYAKKSTYKPGDKDTSPNELVKETFIPKYMSFELDLMQEYGIKETKQKGQTYVY